MRRAVSTASSALPSTRSDAKQSLRVLDWLAVAHQLAGHHAGDFRFDLVHELHRFDDAEHRPGLDGFADPHKGRAAGRRAFVEGRTGERRDGPASIEEL